MSVKTDRELLELAAKAAGITLDPVEAKNVKFQGDDMWIGYMTDPSQWSRGWFSPLTDDGDALRLATELSLNVFHTGGSCFALESDSDGPESSCSYRDCGGKHEATRRAIVRAAAVIGETL